MNTTEHIALSKRKILWGLLYGAILILFGSILVLPMLLLFDIVATCWIWCRDRDGFSSRFAENLKTGAYLSFTHLTNGIRLLDKNPGIEINGDGIIDNASGAAAGEAPWNEIRQMQRVDVGNHEGITIFLDDPQAFVQRRPFIKRTMLRLNSLVYGSPVHISADCLQITRDELYTRLLERYQSVNERRHKSSAPRPEYLVPYQDADKM